ncbi:MAG: hypothetical protein KC549_03775, partial [Myxococcales bacterium]|nr:hypothetical protein [Myxococcales bacterium]
MIDHDDEVPQADAELLARLGRHGRAQAAELDPRLMALAEGRLSPAEQAALAADAAADAELARAVEVFAPLDEAAQDRIADGVLAALGIARAGPVEEAPPAKVLPFRRRPVGRVLMAALPLAAAAAIAVFVLRPGAVVDAPPVPGYALSIEGGEKVQRGDELP